jgi:hypothetical protein
MLAWIPFRATTLRQSFELLGKVINPKTYLHLSFRENLILIVSLVMIGMLLSGFLEKSGYPFLRHPVVRRVAEVAVLSVMIYFVFVFLKPVKQFIYFQF